MSDKDYMKGMSEDEYADWAASLQQAFSVPILCECNGGPPCDCPDCDLPDCGYKVRLAADSKCPCGLPWENCAGMQCLDG